MQVVVRKFAAVAEETVEVLPDPNYVGFTAKAQRSKTRKGKEYFVLRVTIPKYASEQIKAGPDDYLVLKAKKAQWYHMMDWNEMKPAWDMLPQDIKADVLLAGLPNPGTNQSTYLGGVQSTWAGPGLATSSGQMTPQVISPTTSSVNQSAGAQ
jgi:hypothetical protein